MNYLRFGAIYELESAQAVALQKPRCGTTVCVKRKSICVHFEVRKSALNVLPYMKGLQMCAYSNTDNVPKQCAELLYTLCIIAKMRWARILDMCRYHILFYFRKNTLSVIKNKCLFSGGKRTVVPDPLHPNVLSESLYGFTNVYNNYCERPLMLYLMFITK